MPEKRIVITRPLPGDAVAMLREAGFENLWCSEADEPLPRDRLLEVIGGAHAIIANPGDKPIDAEVFDAAGEQLEVVSNFAVGVDNIDVEEAKRRGITVCNTPTPVTEPTADIAWLLLLGAARRAHEAQRLARSGEWTGIGPSMLLGRRIVGKTLLIVGAGRIGTAVARRSIGWEMKVLYRDVQRSEAIEQAPINAQRVELEEGLKEADFISLHTPLLPETRHLINADRLALMKETAVLVNTSRGPVIDEAALAEALRSGRLAAAGLDVYEREPEIHPELIGLENAFLMPHIGSATIEDRAWMTQLTVDNAIAVLNGEDPPHAV
ncbi:MAG: D-glycerate dehydrogenase [Planctomycetota bacterium]|nr:D-glycerate dehydrogenase [Planctomycetota bacterium]